MIQQSMQTHSITKPQTSARHPSVSVPGNVAKTKCDSPMRMLPRPNPLAVRSSRRFCPVAVLRCHRRTTLLAVCFGAALLAGCAVGPNYSRPSTPAQAGWKEGATATNTAKLPIDWWRLFEDTQLNSLETQAVEANQNLKMAVARVTEARAVARVTASELYPSISANGAYSRSRLSANGMVLPEMKLESD